MADINLSIMIDDIIISDGRREINAATVKKLAQSIDQVGLQHPVTVKRKGDKYLLIAGRHRLEACKKLDFESIAARIVSMTNDEAKLWEIAENLHRAELTKLERDDNIAEWIRITERIHASQSGTHQKAGQQPGGVNAAARDLGIAKTDAHRAVKVASLSDEAKDAAKEAGLDDNRSALLAAARETAPEAQVAAIRTYRPTPAITKADEDADHDEGLRVIAARGFLNRAAEAKEIATVGKLQASDVTEAMIKAADDAAAAWSTAARNLSRARNPTVTRATPDHADGDEGEVAPPDVIEENILYAIQRINENARVFNKLLRVSALDREAASRINTAIDKMMGKWRSIQSTLDRAMDAPRQSEVA